jgi:methylglutamate dehydrogenase subunit C
MSTFKRLASGGMIDRTRTISFSFDGRRMTGHAGDTLASALLANDRLLVGRSFKYHRPRGIMAAGVEEPNALVTVDKRPNSPATALQLVDGLAARSQNAWPTLKFDAGVVSSLLSPIFGAGFYYKTFMGPRKKSWMFYEPFIRRAAGLGKGSYDPDTTRYDTRHMFCDCLVVGSGPAGLAAALTAARCAHRAGLRIWRHNPVTR